MQYKNKNQKRTRIVRVNIGLLSTLVIIILLNLVTSNYAASKRYEAAHYVREYEALRDETQQLAVSVAEQQSLSRLTRERERLNLVAAQNILYISAKGAVALNR